jgi:type I restriction enzyme S subunit
VIWPKIPIKRVATIVGGSTPPPDQENWDGPINWLTPTDISSCHGGVVGRSARTLSEKGLASCGAVVAPRNSVVVTTRAPIGNVAVTSVPSATNQGCRTIVSGKDMNSRFLRYQLQVRAEELRNYGSGSTFGELSGASLGMIRVAIPARVEQERIADFLDHESERITALDRELSSLLGSGTSLALSRFSEAVEGIPEVRVGYFYEVQLGKMLDEKRQVQGEDRPYLRNVNVQWDRIDLVNLKEMRFSPADLKRYTARAGDLLVCEGGDPGRCAVWDGPDEICIQKALLRVRPYGRCSVRYLLWMLRLCHSRGDFRADGTGATILHLPAERLRALSVPMPSPEDQRAIARAADETSRAAGRLEKEIIGMRAELDKYRDALITEAVTGRLDMSQLSEARMEEGLAAAREGQKPEVLR